MGKLAAITIYIGNKNLIRAVAYRQKQVLFYPFSHRHLHRIIVLVNVIIRFQSFDLDLSCVVCLLPISQNHLDRKIPASFYVSVITAHHIHADLIFCIIPACC